MIIEKNAKRLGIYFFYDKNGIVDRYVPLFLDEVEKNVSEICIVCNGSLQDDGKDILEKYGKLIVRENKGFDVWAYKTALEYYGWEELEQFDEVIMMNNTIMGPVFPFSETFAKMDSQDLDFWGLTKYFEITMDPFGYSPYGYLPDHIQSHWIACRRSIVKSKEFQSYWMDIPMIENYEQAIGKHESIFTKQFGDGGFKWNTSVEMDDLRSYSGYPLLMCPKKLLKERRCPIFKKRSFFHLIADYLNNTSGEQTAELLAYLRDETSYDVDFIWETLLRSYNQYDIVKNLNLTHVLPTNQYVKEELESSMKATKVALVMHLYFEDLLDESYHYASSMPKEADIYITTDTKDKKAKIETVFSALACNKLEVRVIENRGRDVSSLLVGVKDVIMKYDLVAFVHDKKSAQVTPETIGASFSYKCFENVLSSSAYVANVITLFKKNPRMGLLTPPIPNHSIYFATMGLEWGPNFKVTEKLARKIGVTVPMSKDVPPIAPLGTMFWFRPCAMHLLYEADWNYKDFPKEPNNIDGTLLHAIERVYPFAVQGAGYYPAIGMTDKCASIEYNNLYYYVREYNRVGIKSGLGPYHREMVEKVDEVLSTQGSMKRAFKYRFNQEAQRLLPRSLYEKCKAKFKLG